MTIEEMREQLDKKCSSYKRCGDCPIYGVKCDWEYDDSHVESSYKIMFSKTNIDHPQHYQGAMECIDEMVLVFGKEAVKHFCLCNVWKYRYRAESKNGKEDRDKADWYMKKYQELSYE